MISEPEMVPEGHFGAAELPGQRPPPDEVMAAGDPPAAARPARPAWLWALGGAAVASVVWAGGLYAYMFAAPDLGGYRTSRNLCVDAELKTLSSAIGGREGEGTAAVSEHETLEDASCYLALRPTGYEIPVDEDGNELGALPEVSVGYRLHKKTDPGPEFAGDVAARHEYPGAGSTVRQVDGLGERAYVVRDSTSVVLEVLDGQAVITMSLSSYPDVDSGERTVDLTDVEPLLAADIEALMVALRTKG